jgi:hypothetical protein
LRPQDIRYGEYLELYGKKFLINGCDTFTANYFKEKLSIDFPVSELELP